MGELLLVSVRPAIPALGSVFRYTHDPAVRDRDFL
jgi:hypothetical protein